MAESTAISWAEATFNPWIGCTKVSEACRSCYAERETFVRVQREKGRELWGPTAERHRTSAANWQAVRSWNKKALAAGRRVRVFCASLADVFEDRWDLDPWRLDLWCLIEECGALDFLLLTKRPEKIWGQLPDEWRQLGLPNNIWLGTTAENQETFNRRVPELLQVPAIVHWLSAEPLLGPISLDYNVGTITMISGNKLRWVIVGGESGPDARPIHPAWVRSIRDECIAAGTAFHFKQWGEFAPTGPLRADQWVVSWDGRVIPNMLANLSIADHERKLDQPTVVYQVGKKAAGRILDGRTWDQVPEGMPF
jgi:protein gp37